MATISCARKRLAARQSKDAQSCALPLDFMGKGDVLIVTRLDRLARSMADLYDIMRDDGTHEYHPDTRQEVRHRGTQSPASPTAARAVSGHTAAPLSRTMNLRRRIRSSDGSTNEVESTTGAVANDDGE